MLIARLLDADRGKDTRVDRCTLAMRASMRWNSERRPVGPQRGRQWGEEGSGEESPRCLNERSECAVGSEPKASGERKRARPPPLSDGDLRIRRGSRRSVPPSEAREHVSGTRTSTTHARRATALPVVIRRARSGRRKPAEAGEVEKDGRHVRGAGVVGLAKDPTPHKESRAHSPRTLWTRSGCGGGLSRGRRRTRLTILPRECRGFMRH